MPFPFHTIELADGSNPNQSDKLVGGLLLSVANASGSGSVTTAVSFPAGSLRANYAVFVDAGQAVTAYVTGKTSSGFNVVLAATSVAAGTFNVWVVG
jgi:hypothetical protein